MIAIRFGLTENSLRRPVEKAGDGGRWLEVLVRLTLFTHITWRLVYFFRLVIGSSGYMEHGMHYMCVNKAINSIQQWSRKCFEYIHDHWTVRKKAPAVNYWKQDEGVSFATLNCMNEVEAKCRIATLLHKIYTVTTWQNKLPDIWNHSCVVTTRSSLLIQNVRQAVMRDNWPENKEWITE